MSGARVVANDIVFSYVAVNHPKPHWTGTQTGEVRVSPSFEHGAWKIRAFVFTPLSSHMRCASSCAS